MLVLIIHDNFSSGDALDVSKLLIVHPPAVTGPINTVHLLPIIWGLCKNKAAWRQISRWPQATWNVADWIWIDLSSVDGWSHWTVKYLSSIFFIVCYCCCCRRCCCCCCCCCCCSYYCCSCRCWLVIACNSTFKTLKCTFSSVLPPVILIDISWEAFSRLSSQFFSLHFQA